VHILAPTSAEELDSYTPVALTADEVTLLKSVLDRLFPEDDFGAGATGMGAFVFIDRWLAGPSSANLPLYQDGLAAIDAAAGTGGFSALSGEDQDGILMQAEAGTLADLPTGFFPTLLTNMRQGIFSDPMYGGNVNFAGWDLIGYPGIKLVWSEAEQEMDIDVKPEHKSVADYGGMTR
jgi:hypothetical protein